jgi:hypothetical protein
VAVTVGYQLVGERLEVIGPAGMVPAQDGHTAT